jgi:hypothetical protein
MADKRLEGRALHDYFSNVVGATAADSDMAWNKPPKELTGPMAKVPEILDCYQVDDCGAPGSVWQAYNAVTRHATHGHNLVKKGKRASDASRLRSILISKDGANYTRKAFELASEIAA